MHPSLTQLLTIPSTTMASLWYCCGCNFGPHNSALYDSCINCGLYRCARCVDEKVSDHLNNHHHTHCHETSPYPSVAPTNTARTLSLNAMPSIPVPDLSGVRPLYRPSPAVPTAPLGAPSQHYSQTYMYICCNCQDGPKVYNVQPVCVVCDHAACGQCTNVK